MYIGLDVGGTHTDAVLVDENGVQKVFKAVTDHKNLHNSVNKALREVTGGIDPKKIVRVNLSTTLSTNAIVEQKIEDVGIFVSSGPGVDPGNFCIGKNYHVLEGSIDHRGTVIKELDTAALEQALSECAKKGTKVFAAVTKFSTRNPIQEKQIGEQLMALSEFTSLGYRMASQLSFPRRVATAYFNSAVWRIFGGFAGAIKSALDDLGISAEVNILKADGGTMPLVRACEYPVESILSGPAASIMGIISLCHIKEDSIILDIGGTTTDISIFASGAPIIEREGISLGSYPTLVRSLKTKSIGVGGDSFIGVSKNGITVGPVRKGLSMADGGKHPTLIDALNVKGIIQFGDTKKSIDGINALAKKGGTSPESFSARVIECAVESIKSAVDGMISEINEKPVYTIHELLEGKKIKPSKIYVMGGPARAFMELLSGSFNIDVTVPKNYEVANAIGAALAKNTIEAELFADTSRNVLAIPNLNIYATVNKQYTLEQAEADAKRYLALYLESIGADVKNTEIDIVESTSFKMVEGWSSTGRDIRVKCQIRPGVIMDFH